ncbi:MAG TPA: DUF1249 domain-containing protein [Xanthomonadaceae bacterium]|jgi:uncharacterized protein YqiB (DUF1249 family)|nr:DUF1249 domain-containing protein [Xanthomonadaceae bacterium]
MRQNRVDLPFPAIGRFAWLMGLYAENFERIARWVDLRTAPLGHYVSTVGDGLDIHLEIVARHAHTVELRLSYAMVDPLTGAPDPSAALRAYLDSRQAEATHCYVGRHWQDVLGLRPSPQAMMGHRLRMNSFLSKWLGYLEALGHGAGSLQPGAPPQSITRASMTNA